MQIQFRDLKTQYKRLKTEIDSAVTDVMTNANFIMGSHVKELEEQLANYVGVKHCITCANGTDALQLTAMTMGLGEGDAVFVPDFTFFSSGEIVSLVGATPIFVDVDRDTFNMDADKLEARIIEVMDNSQLKPKAIIAVDLFGQPADYVSIRKVAEKYQLYLIEDGAQGFGGRINGKMACSFGDISTTSFFPAKPLGCYGDGGAVFTNNDEWAEMLRSYRVHGKGQNKYDNLRIGLNSRLDTVQAAILKVKLKAFGEYEVDEVNRVANLYTELLANVEEVATPKVPENMYSSWAQYTLRCQNETTRNELQKYLKEKDIPSMIYYPKAMSEQEAFQYSDSFKNHLDVTKNLCKTVLSLPMHPYLTDDDVKCVVLAIKEFFA